MKKTQTAFILVLAACCALFLTNLGGRDFWAPDEGDFAQITKELDNDLIVPHLNGEAYGEKPPLFYYAVFACAKLFRWLPEEASMRLASSFAAIAVIVVFFLALKARFGLTRTLYATAMLGLAPLFYWQARYLQVDMVFSAALVVALLFFFQFMETGRKAWYYLFFICLALAFMTKGPLSVALAAPVIVLYCATERRWRPLFNRHTCLGILLFIAIVLPWYLAVYAREGFPYLYENILRQNFLRFFDAWSHKRPFYYYFTTLPLDFFPWSLFLPLGLYAAVRSWKTDRWTRFFTLWFVWFFFFLSLSSGKISKYMLPALPALAVIVSGTITDTRHIYNRIVSTVTAGILAALGIALIVYRTSLYGEFLPERIILGLLAICAGVLIFLSMRLHRARAAFASIAVFMALAYMTGNVSIFEKWNRYKSPKPMALKIRALAGDTVPWVYYGNMRGVYVYYVGRFAVHVEEHDVAGLKELASRRNEFYLLTRGRDADEVTGALPGAAMETEDRIGDTAMVLFRFKRGNSG
ncbi:MAG: Undecaprenyl phosphate-alpha-4-amino-4-deoxy-L-arabinose arabinosyl transferase [Syntrophorhabdus sp. PtaB.Bin047]|jgi:4-amino-4-deoxy-L-arabinose transferase-like glycosyltransferase|nr:MAG: Undecaprenyl phosphate-alpha-4-amino-4-deoxy-L-arabinose arabinosyl transferase [Syntrophorhabdus sp. PtaB.Bin047]